MFNNVNIRALKINLLYELDCRLINKQVPVPAIYRKNI